MKARILVAAILGCWLLVFAQERFDLQVRTYFFTGFQGNQAALDKGMKIAEDALAADPQNAEALVWHGAGVSYKSSQAFATGDAQKGMELWRQGMSEMDKAVAMAPDNVGVRIPRGSTLLTMTRYIPDPAISKPLIAKGVSDFEKAYELQKDHFNQLGVHARGELMLGLADGYSRLGENEKAQPWFERIRTELKGSLYEDSANVWLKTKSLSPREAGCLGCHTGN